jgi:cysteine-rich repeat protein
MSHKKPINIFFAVYLILLLAMNTIQAAIETGTSIKTYLYDVRKDTRKSQWTWGIVNAHINHRCPYNLSDEVLSTRGPSSDKPAACLWDVFPTSELSPPIIPKSILCKKIFEQHSLPAESPHHLVAFSNSKWGNLQEKELIVDGRIESVDTSVGLFWSGNIGSNSSSLGGSVAGLTFYSAKGPSDSSNISFFPFKYGDPPKKFIISRIFYNLTTEDLTFYDFKGENLDKLCATQFEEYGQGVVAHVTWLDEANKQLGQPSYVCLYNNTYAGNNDNKKMIATDNTGKKRHLFFWSESTLPELTQSEIDVISSCRIDTDYDGIPDHADPCPARKPDIFGDAHFQSRFKTTPLEERWQMTLPYEPDRDGDGVGDNCDNCPTIFNPDQKNTSDNPNGIGDACNPSMMPKETASNNTANMSTSFCGNLLKEPGEECDLGTDLNLNSSFGCTPECKTVPGWTCNKNLKEFQQNEIEAASLHIELSSKQDNFFINNGCANYISTINESSCADYQKRLSRFMQFNVIIKMDCAAAGAKTKLKQRATALGTVADYDVKCK